MNSSANIAVDDEAVAHRAVELFQLHADAVESRTSRLLAGLMIVQWLGAIALSVALTPLTWTGSHSSIHPRVVAAIYLGFLLCSFPGYFAWRQPAHPFTKHLIAACQMMWSGLLIYVSGGRIETHFHVFGSLAFLAFYRDWKVLLMAVVVVTSDHIARGILWPLTIYGELNISPWRTFEHAGWVLFEGFFLSYSCRQRVGEIRQLCEGQARLESTSRVLKLKFEEEQVYRHEAESANFAKSAFLASMSHEIRTPLNGIRGVLHLLGRRQLPIEQLQLLNVGIISCDTLGSLLNDVLDFSKIEAKKLDLSSELFDLRVAIEQTVDMQAQRARDNHVALTSYVDPAVPELINADRLRVMQILMNLVGNAIKFTTEGAVSIEVTGERIRTDNCVLNFTVKDTGIGLDPEQRTRLFQPFSQADASTTKKYGGTGLGLAICRELVELMHGEIGVESEPHRGSTFWFRIPVSFPPEELQTNRMFRLEQSRVKVLLVGDRDQFQETLSRQICGWGFSVERISRLQSLAATLEVARIEEEPVSIILVAAARGDELAHYLASSQIELDPYRGIPIALMPWPLGNSPAKIDLLDARVTCLARPLKQSNLFDDILSLLVRNGNAPSILPHADRTVGTGIGFSQARVLVAEDNEVNQLIIRELLRIQKIEPLIVGNGRLAVDALQSADFDLVFMDCHMPDMDGFEACAKIRNFESQNGKTKTPIVALTADVTTEAREQCSKVGMNVHLPKPIDPDVLETLLAEFLGDKERCEPLGKRKSVSVEASKPTVPLSASVKEDFVSNAE